jgi:ketosteroid isomerase-like protein
LSLVEIIVMAAYDPNLPTGLTQGSSALQRKSSVQPHFDVDNLYRRFARAFASMDATLLKQLLAEHAVLIGQDATAFDGPDAIVAEFDTMFRRVLERGMRLRIVFDVVERSVRDDVVYDRGSYTLSCRIAAAEVPLRRGRYLAVFRRGDGSIGHRLDTASVYPLLQNVRTVGITH